MKSHDTTARPPAGPAHTAETDGRRARPGAFMAALVALSMATAISPPSHAQAFKVLYTFTGYPTDGSQPDARLLMDASGNLYGTTVYGGKYDDCSEYHFQCGTVFKLDTNGVETVLHNFSGPDGANPASNLVMDASGALYGTTEFGGYTHSCVGTESEGCGVVFKLSSDGKETVLYRFTGGDDGAWALAGLVMDPAGALYGTTAYGGLAGEGVAFKLVGKKETVLHSFCSWPNCDDGAYIGSGLIMDAAGNLYGTATFGGDTDCGCGVVYKLAGKKETILHAFKGPPDGGEPVSTLYMDSSGNLYGTTAYGGTFNYSAGTVFEWSPGGKERVLHKFHPYTKDGYHSQNAVVQDATGNLYGTTAEGGIYSGGVLYEITTDGKEKIVHTFCGGDCSDGAHPNDLIIDSNGNLYGTTYGGGTTGNGVIFMITP